MALKKTDTPSQVEKLAVEKSGFKLIYQPSEQMGLVVMNNFPLLGKLAALRFLEWVLANPGGTISLPTGKTPEHFIKWVTYYLSTWDNKETQNDLQENGIDSTSKPDMHSLHFVQIDEFYPIDPSQRNSFHFYVNKYYIKGFGLDPKKALLIDCRKTGLPEGMNLDDIWPGGIVDLSLRFRHATTNLETLQKSVLEEIDQWCYQYDEAIRQLGGIGFFLGGIGPDGHIAFNVLGSDHHSTTRLTPLNYETQAAAASDLGGIEVAKKRHAITIGLGTISFDPKCTAIIIAAGEAKAPLIQKSIYEKTHVRYPATALHRLPNARFYITLGAARDLAERQYVLLNNKESVSKRRSMRIVIDLALNSNKTLLELEEKDFKKERFARTLVKKSNTKGLQLAASTHDHLIQMLENGTQTYSNKTFLHTAPHHDDIMLGYFPYVVRNMRDATNKHHFTYLTSGFNAVTNEYALAQIENLKFFIRRPEFKTLFRENYFSTSSINHRNRDVWQYLDGVAADDNHMKQEGQARRLYRILMETFEEHDPDNLEDRISELLNYFRTQYAGKKDLVHIQRIKGMMREWEADCLWGYMGFDTSTIHHLRLGFYKGDLFTEDPTLRRDIPPILKLLHDVSPDVVGVAFDPEASGPDTHYKVLQAVAEALKIYEKETGRSDIEVVGYRNVWYRFHPGDADVILPVSLNMFAAMENAFLNSFVSQKDASFPSYEFDGPFSGLARQIQVAQYQALKTCLGRKYFNDHKRPLLRATRGVVYIRKMTLNEFYATARELKESLE
ncbi:glucosamine-6-phosphate deaminase [bacterium]|nr:glucosamine-6-phosphate deaminase [bacterium]